MPHFLLVCGDSSRPVGIAIMEASSMLQAHTNGMAQGLAGPEPFGEVHELSAKMMKLVLPAQIGRIISGAEAAQVIARLVEGRGNSSPPISPLMDHSVPIRLAQTHTICSGGDPKNQGFKEL
jgi:hypothetical protein